jgi:thiol-disulfide isomerase/thioredoxin
MKCEKLAFLCNYFKKKSIFSIFFDLVFVVIIVLLVNPGTRTDVAAFFIKLTSLPPSTLDTDEQFELSDEAKNWKIYDYKLHPISLEELNDKPVFLNIWATWCPPCIAELPGILDVYQDYKDKVHFVLISNESPDKVKSFLDKNKYDKHPFYFYQRLPGDLQTKSIPTTYIIDKAGKVVLEKKGSARWSSGKIRKLLDGLSDK